MTDSLKSVTHAQNIRFDKAAEALYIIDQSLLPQEEREIRLQTAEEMVEATKNSGSGAPPPSVSAPPTASTSWPAPSRKRTPPPSKTVSWRIPPS